MLLLIGICFLARPLVLDAARVKENCFSLSFIAAPSCQTWPRVSTGKFCRVSGGFAPSPRAWAGGSGRAARQCARSSAIPGQTGPEEAGAGHKPAFKPAWKKAGLSRLAHSRSPGWGPRRHRVRRCRARRPAGTGRGRRVVPGAEVSEDLLHSSRVINHRDDPHRVLADGTTQRINMPDAQDQVPPPLGGQF